MQSRGDVSINNFVKGLITEASPLTFPQGASLDEVNFALLRDGSRERRLGLDLEENYGLHDSGLSADVLNGARVQAYRWSVPNGNVDQDIGVIQLGNRIYFIDLYTQNPSANLLNGGAPITTSEITNDVLMTFTTINNYLVGIANQLPQPYLFTYNPYTDVVSVETAPIQVRDLWGVEDEVDVGDRPTILSPEHKYNLLNQGWLDSIVSTCGGGITAIDCTFNTFGVYPSNSDQWSIGRIEDLTSADVKKFDPEIASRNLVSTGQVARGHFIIDLYNRGASRSAQTGLTLPVDRELSRINAIAAYAGRIFYGGVLSRVVGADNRSPNLSNMVLFSQLFENKFNLVKCYQEADPTDPGINDIVDTDGGYVLIPECSYIFALKQVKQSLFVFAINGVWEIRGDEGGFRATSYQVNKVSNIGVYAPKSIVEVNGVVYFWGVSGIYMITQNDFGTWDTNSLTIPTIQKLYNAIPDGSKKNARGFYDLAQNRARWMYYSSSTKEFGEAIDIDEVPIAVLPSISSPQSVVFGFEMAYVDCTVLDTNRYVIIGTRALAGSRFIYGVVATVGTDNTVSFGSATLLENSYNDYREISVCALTSSKIFISGISRSLGRANGIYCTISGSTITAQSVVFTGTTASANVQHSKTIKIDNNRALMQYQGNVSGVDAFVADISTGSVVFGARAAVDAFSADKGDLEDSQTPGTFYSFCGSTGSIPAVHPLTVSGSSITVGSTWPSTLMDSGSAIYNITFLSNGKYALRARNSTTGSTVKVVDSTGNLATINTTNADTHTYADIIGTTRNRTHLFYARPSSIELEEFTWNGSSTLTSNEVTVIDSSIIPISINIANDGFNNTKFPIVYIDNTSSLGVVKTVIIEVGE